MKSPTHNLAKTKKLLKILIGAAWIDGVIQPEERQYLQNMAKDEGLAEDPEIKPLLSEIKQVSPEKCYEWVKAYLGENHNPEDYQELLEALSALIYSDGEVQTQEAKLLSQLQALDPTNEPHQTIFDKILKTVQTLYRTAIADQAK
ncbi:TerB family tellurite resistance protein [Spirulina sp. CS-785/01]|uniref:tellurite resistance TerB family protein n=1 Tax=Spirulina sp. CS-785/01 TaxID=3021716 RepID=UPI00232D1896|nr:TerB family tellurite resistance protein [Spirulina sp. CS-785/01]MDB9312588.1 TerB family tellurite resistance protein [Spirulina sp. CS-785/01]